MKMKVKTKQRGRVSAGGHPSPQPQKDVSPAEAAPSPQGEGEKDAVQRTIEERAKVYGDPRHSHVSIGLAWTGLIQQHFEITLAHPIPASLVAQMMVVLKMQRSARVYHADNYVDAAAYTRFAVEFQKGERNVGGSARAGLETGAPTGGNAS